LGHLDSFLPKIWGSLKIKWLNYIEIWYSYRLDEHLRAAFLYFEMFILGPLGPVFP